MISLQITLGASGSAHFSFASGLIAKVHLTPPADGSSHGLTISRLEPAFLSLTTATSQLTPLTVDITEGPDPLWLAYTIDCTGGASVSVGFAGSPTVIVDPGSRLSLEYNNGNQPTA